MVKLNTLYRLIKKEYNNLENHIKWQNEFVEIYGDNLEVQNSIREMLNGLICGYVALGGKRDISKYCKYYV